ncbi:MAG: hypothetical protein GC181_09175 [Bacteroidetes bacterium]|nr:hypothetical protein [Bacteroidota bacterium]
MLNQPEILKIKERLDEYGTFPESVKNEWLDHICCLVEEFLSQGFEFEKASEFAFDRFCANDLSSIHEQFQQMVKPNINLMKKMIQAATSLCLMTLCAGILLNYLHMKWGRIMLDLGLLSCMFYAIPVHLSIGNITDLSLKIIRYRKSLLVSSFVIGVGTLLSVLHLKGATVLLILGVFVLMILIPGIALSKLQVE